MLVDQRVTVSISHAFAILNDFLMIFAQNMDVFENGVHPQRAISIGKSMLNPMGIGDSLFSPKPNDFELVVLY